MRFARRHLTTTVAADGRSRAYGLLNRNFLLPGQG